MRCWVTARQTMRPANNSSAIRRQPAAKRYSTLRITLGRFNGAPSCSTFVAVDDGASNAIDDLYEATEFGGDLPERFTVEALRSRIRGKIARPSIKPDSFGLRLYYVDDVNVEDDADAALYWLRDDHEINVKMKEVSDAFASGWTVRIIAELTSIRMQNTMWATKRLEHKTAQPVVTVTLSAQQAAHTGNQLRLIARDGGAAATPAREQPIVTEAHARAPNCSGSTGRPVGTQLGPLFLRHARDTRNKGEQYFLLQNRQKRIR